MLNLDDATIPLVRRQLRAEFEAAMQGAPSEPTSIMLGQVTPDGAARINRVFREAGVDLDVTGFHHVIDAYATRHAFKEHGHPPREVPRGQLAITAEDWAAIPDVLASPDHIEYLGRSPQGRDLLGYWKRVNGATLFVEEARTGRRILAAVSMRKFKGRRVPGRPDGP